jgi:hypothetical protein
LEIIVEAGTDDQKDAIISEINSVYSFLDKYRTSLNLYQVIVPANFEQTIRDISDDQTYNAILGQIAIAKIVDVPEGVSIVFSPWIYIEQYDFQVRVIWYIHELFHAINKI